MDDNDVEHTEGSNLSKLLEGSYFSKLLVNSSISEMIVKDSGISEIGTKDSGILEIGTKDSGILEIGTKDSGISKGSYPSMLLEDMVRRRQDMVRRRQDESRRHEVFNRLFEADLIKRQLDDEIRQIEEKKSLLYLQSDNDSDADIGISSTSGPTSYEKISLPSPMSDNDYDDIDKTSSTAVFDADDNLEEHFKIFKSKFLDKRSNIKADVCNVLESFTWLRGEYGTAGPNEKMPFPHLYVMVDDNQEKSNEIIKQEIDGKFGWEASKYIDLPRKAPKKANFRFLSDFRAARKDQNDVRSRGTLTMICRKEDQYFALTCAHVGVDSDFVDCQGVFNGEVWLEMRDALNSSFMKYNMVYFYQPSYKDSEVQLGHGPNDVVSRLDEETDIMRISVDKTDFNRCLGKYMEGFQLSLENANDELFRRVVQKNERVEARITANNKSKHSKITEYNYCYWSQYLKRPIFRNAVKVQSDVPFFEDGDSGALVCFLDESDNWEPFAYAVAEEVDGNKNGSESNEDCSESDDSDREVCFAEPARTFICFKLDKALEEVNLENGEYFGRNDSTGIVKSALRFLKMGKNYLTGIFKKTP